MIVPGWLSGMTAAAGDLWILPISVRDAVVMALVSLSSSLSECGICSQAAAVELNTPPEYCRFRSKSEQVIPVEK